MRWFEKPPSPNTTGDIRLRTGFLWLPKKLDRQWRWLENASWQEVYIRFRGSQGWEGFWQGNHWTEGNLCPHGYDDWDQCAVCGH